MIATSRLPKQILPKLYVVAREKLLVKAGLQKLLASSGTNHQVPNKGKRQKKVVSGTLTLRANRWMYQNEEEFRS
jgi:hypothetical protein